MHLPTARHSSTLACVQAKAAHRPMGQSLGYATASRFACGTRLRAILVGTFALRVWRRWNSGVRYWRSRRTTTAPGNASTAAFSRIRYVAVAEARAKVGQVQAGSGVPNDPAAFAKFSSAQAGLSSALSRLLAVSESYPDLKASQNFADLQAQLEGTENRIAVERMRFNEAAQTFNTTRDSFPTVLIAGFFGSRFVEKSYFKSAPGSAVVPQVKL